MHTGYTTDKVSPSGQLEPPEPQGLPHARLEHHQVEAADRADAAVRDDAAAAAGVATSSARAAAPGSWARAYDPYLLYPTGDDMDMTKMDRVRTDDLKLREELTAGPHGAPGHPPRHHLQGDAGDREGGRQARPRRVLRQGARAGHQRPGEEGVRPEPRRRPPSARSTARTPSASACLLARRLVEAGTRFVEVVWPKVANSDNHSWDVHAGPLDPHEEPVGPDARRRPRRR